ncbi:MAG: hypothetical protein Q9162_005101 [Coniocarpon cinnabarinum]
MSDPVAPAGRASPLTLPSPEIPSVPLMEEDSSSSGDDWTPSSPRKRRRRLRSSNAEGSVQPLSQISEASVHDIDAIERLLSSPTAPSVAVLYRPDASDSGANHEYEYFPLACFYQTASSFGSVPSLHRLDLLSRHNWPLAKSSLHHPNPWSWPDEEELCWSANISHGRRRPLFPPTQDPEPSTSQFSPSRGKAALKGLSASDVPRPLVPSEIPVEVFELIAQHLTLSDVKNMRLVNHSFERGVSAHLFENVVVPFSTNMYGTLASKLCQAPRFTNGKGERGASSWYASDDAALETQEDDLDVFRGFGPHIRRFGISFTVNERELSLAQPKKGHQKHKVYWGDFRWPVPEYPRFEDRASLESTADETSVMKGAFCHLRRVRHLAISIDSGLGWLSGPDQSIRSRILHQSTYPFEKYQQSTEPQVEKRREFWTVLENAYEVAQDSPALKMAELARYEKPEALHILDCCDSSNAFKLGHNLLDTASHYTHRVGVEDSSTSQEGFKRTPAATELRLPFSVTSTLNHYTQFQPGHSNHINGSSATTANAAATLDQTAATRPQSLLSSMSVSLARGVRQQDRLNLAPAEMQPGPAMSRPAQNRCVTRCYRKGRASGRGLVCNDFLDRLRPKQEAGTATSDDYLWHPRRGVLYTRPLKMDEVSARGNDDGFKANNLSQSQREWLMETGWAQDAFLSSYMLSVVDNSETLRFVQTMTLTPFSSCHLTKLLRPDFWDALPGLKELELMVLPDWRQIDRHPAGYTSAPSLMPTKALDTFHSVLQAIAGNRRNIKAMKLGWAVGGEHAEGMHARNRILMPAPVTKRDDCLPPADASIAVLALPHVEKLSLVNCWIAPNVLQDFVHQHLGRRLSSLDLESVSLTAHPKYPSQGLGGVGGGLGAAALAAAMGGGGMAAPLGANAFHHVTQQQVNAWAQMQTHAAHFPNVPNNAFLNAGLPGFPGAGAGQQLQQNNPGSRGQLRDGSWLGVLSKIRDWSALSKRRLRLNFLSCGYAWLPRAGFDQSAIELSILFSAYSDGPQDRHLQAWFTRKFTIVGGTLLQSGDSLLGRVASALPPFDESLLQSEWGLSLGWPDLDLLGDHYDDQDGWGKWGFKNKAAAEYDGERPGGFGRFSGSTVFPSCTTSG